MRGIKLQVLIPLIVILILLVIGISSAGLVLHYQQKNSIIQLEKMATSLSSAVRASLEQGMLTNDRTHTQTQIDSIKEEDMIAGIDLFTVDGTIAASSETSRVGSQGDSNQLIQTIVQGKVSIEMKDDKTKLLTVTTPIFNNQKCQLCHTPDKIILGAIGITLDATLIEDQIRRDALVIALLGGVTFLIIGGGLAIAMKVTTLDPLSNMVKSAKSLSLGDYSTRTDLPKIGDEINTLARTFNEMAEKVEQRTREVDSSRRQLAELNANLEIKVQQRTQEISDLNTKLGNVNLLRKQLLEKVISAQEEERRRIARDLHDCASQSLAAVAINLSNIADILPGEYQDSKDKLELLKEQTIQTLDWIRNLGVELRPSILDDLGLFAAIEWYSQDYLGKRNIDVKIHLNGQSKLPEYTETMLFRIVQEALINVVKHSEATLVHIYLNVSESWVVLRIEDNGKGFDFSSTINVNGLRQHLGIHGMIERSSMLGGDFDIKSGPGEGTKLYVKIPIIGEVPDQ